MNRTKILVALLAVVTLMQLFPDRARLIERVAIVAGGLYFLSWTALRYLAQRKKRTAASAQSAADDLEYQAYKRALDAIRENHDPGPGLRDPTSISPEYQAQLSALHDKHQDMLTRKFGPR